MKYLPLLACLLLASCHTSRPPSEVARPAEAIGPVDSVVVTPHRSLVDKLVGRKPQADIVVGQLPANIGKKSTVAIYYGPATVSNTTVGKKATAATAEGATATTIGKVKAPTAIGDSATATDNTKAGQRGGAAATAPNATATATTQKGGLPWWVYLIGAGLVGYAGVRLYRKFTAV